MGQASSSEARNLTVENFDPTRYVGIWHEIAKYPLRWESDCENAIASYTFLPNNNIRVVNTCVVDGKEIRKRSGEAKFTDQSGKLLLTFTDGLPSDGESPYWVHETDYDNYAIVGGPSGQYLWILSRGQKMRDCKFNEIKARVSAYGYNPEKLVLSKDVLVPCNE